MDVRDLLEHLVMVLRRVACAGRGDDPWSWPVGAPDVADEQFGEAWRAAARDVDAAWRDDALLERPTTLPWGTFSGTEVLGVYTNEIAVHTWDLAQATGQSVQWDPAVLAFADAAIHASCRWPIAPRCGLRPRRRSRRASNGRTRSDLPSVCRSDVPLIDRLVAWNGRRPPSADTRAAAVRRRPGGRCR